MVSSLVPYRLLDGDHTNLHESRQLQAEIDRNCTGRCHDTCVGNMSRESGKGWLAKHIRLMKCTNRQGVFSHEVSERNRNATDVMHIHLFIHSFEAFW
jgi:hypothetical protein